MDASAFEKMPQPSSSNPSKLSDDDNAFKADSRQLPLSNEGVGVQNLLYSRPSPLLVKAAVLAKQFRFLSRTASPVTSIATTPTTSLARGHSHIQTVKIFKALENVKKTNDQGVRILAIDNGGICTFSTLYALEIVMLQVGELPGVPEGEEIVQQVFSEETPISKGGYVYSAERLEAIFIDIIARHASSSMPSFHLPMKDDKIGDRCRTFVVSRYDDFETFKFVLIEDATSDHWTHLNNLVHIESDTVFDVVNRGSHIFSFYIVARFLPFVTYCVAQCLIPFSPVLFALLHRPNDYAFYINKAVVLEAIEGLVGFPSSS
ncbi:hypothetical protein BT69DRAFT_1295985 [Atractiella rhizophila]|nr:hypothetical protein BT69DRAFT_1295985 [Atractiella rhizophila]